ncbi:cell division protein FtsA [Pseudothermotoga sp.]|nr:cell division protein FtsA [Pseudothermotoga sp.]MCX7812995.1 cell division protein FtsA [Pseudothermotoga sp.]MDW8139766.1 cell division protein FtsA [Pseudothermotoga sp.]
MRRGETYCLIDIGSHTVKGAILVYTPQGLEVLAKAAIKSRGIESGEVKDVTAVNEVIEALIDELEKESRVRRADFIVSSSHSNVQLVEHRAELVVSENEKKIIDESIVESLRTSVEEELSTSYRVLHFYPKRYLVDGTKLVINPVGMTANKVKFEATAIVMERNSSSVFDFLAETLPEPLLYGHSTLFASECVLSDVEKENGVCIIDLGHSHTFVVIYFSSVPAKLHVIPLGVKHVLRDISIVLGTSTEEAERLLRSEGSAVYGDSSYAQRAVEYRGLDGRTLKTTTKEELARIIHARLREILTKARRTVREFTIQAPVNMVGKLPGGVVFVGGGAKIPRLIDLALDVFEGPARVGTFNVANLSILNDEEISEDPAFCAVLGGVAQLLKHTQPVAPAKQSSSKQSFFRKLIEMFKSLW